MQSNQVNPYQQVLDSEAYEILTKCDPKLATAILSIALKKFSETKEFKYFLKPDFKDEFNSPELVQDNNLDPNANLSNNIQNQPIPQNSLSSDNSNSSPISVNW